MNAARLIPAALCVGGAALGLAGAYVARQAIIPNAGVEYLQPNVWAVIAVPLGLAIGAVAARPRFWPSAIAWSVAIYFVSLFIAARLERLLIGPEAALAEGHLLYFAIVPWVQFAGALALAWERGRLHPTGDHTTMPPESAHS